ncbi:MAG TPA: hypothetical protein G4N96_12570, partial [Chloroflexi bacterium]|nr:hypothetical protein [Chloroflexota bacterium]
MSQENQTSESTPGDDLPDWLRELRGDDAPPSETKEPPSPPPEKIEPKVADDEELPDWLQDVDADESEAEEQPPEASEAVSEPAAAEVDDADDLWKQILAEEGLDLDDIAEERPEGAEDMSVEDWMAATAGESAQRQAKSDLVQPKESKPKPEPEPQPVSDVFPPDEDTGDDLWKQILAEEGLDLDDIAEERPEGAEGMSVEDWMAATAGESAQRQTKAQLIQPKEPEPKPEMEAPSLELEDDGIVAADGLPDWLKSDQPVEAEVETPSWLSDESVFAAGADEAAEAEAPSLELEDDGMVVDEELPDWLRADVSADAEAETPGWLSDESVFAADADKAAEAEAPSLELEDDGIVADEELPDWLRADVLVDVEAETPDWLSDESVLAADADVEAEAKAEAPEAVIEFDEEALIDSEDLPDWLQEGETLDEAPQLPEEAAPAAEVDAPESFDLEDDGIVDIESLPDWLQDAQSLDEAVQPGEEIASWLADTAAEEEAVAEEEAETPDWLQLESEAEAVEIERSADAPDWLKSVAADQADVPDWLDETISVEEAAPTEAPAWLEQVHAPEVAEIVESEEAEAVAEVEPVKAEAEAVEPGAMEKRLAVMQAALGAGDLDEALQAAREMLGASQGIEQIIEYLGGHLKKHPDKVSVYEVLGDAQVKGGYFNRALETYRTALSKL